MPIELTRRTFVGSLAASTVAAALPVPAAVIATDPYAELRVLAAQGHISELGHTSFWYWYRCVGWSHIVFQRGNPPTRPSHDRAHITDQDFVQLYKYADSFEIVVAEFFARPSPTPYFIERKRFLLESVAEFEEIIPRSAVASRWAEWARIIDQDARRVDMSQPRDLSCFSESNSCLQETAPSA